MAGNATVATGAARHAGVPCADRTWTWYRNQRRCTYHAATFQALESAVFEAQGWLTEQLVKQIVVLRAVLQWNLLRSNAVHFAVQQLG